MAATIPAPDLGSVRDEWVSSVGVLAQNIRKWSEARGWRVEVEPKHIREEGLGEYEVPIVRIEAPAGLIEFEPIARRILGTTGRIDIYAPGHVLKMLRAATDAPDPVWTIYAPGLYPLYRGLTETNFDALTRTLLELTGFETLATA